MEQTMLKLTNENYYSPESNMAYMSASQFKSFESCPSRTMAMLRGEHHRPFSTALLVGGYIDAAIEGTLDQYKEAHPEMFKKDGTLKVDYIKAEQALERINRDELFKMILDGEKQKIVVGTIGGVPYKGKIDVLLNKEQCQAIAKKFPKTAEVFDSFCDGCIVDFKYMRDFVRTWSDDEQAKVSFIDAWGYHTQLAIYQRLEGHMLPCIIAAITKEDEPDLDLFYIPQVVLDERIRIVEDHSATYDKMKRGEIEADSCGKCDWCRSQKKLDEIHDYRFY